MTAERVEGVLGLSVLLGACVCVVRALVADARAQRAHDAWQRRWSAWLDGGMKGPRP